MPQDSLTISVCTVAWESAFSIGGKTISPNRSSLKSKTVQDWRREEHSIALDFDHDSKSCDEAINEDDDDESDATSFFD